MKINRFFAMAVLALLVVAAMGAISARSFAQTAQPSSQVEVTPAPENNPNTAETDTIDEQVGDQNESGGQETAGEADVEGAGEGHDNHHDEQSPAYNGSIAVDPSITQGLSDADESAALAKLATITADQANAAALAANAGATIVKTDLEADSGTLVYNVELNNGVEVIVDAGNGTILATETGDGN